jgi:phosphoesterase RecJ-like protein
MWDSVQKFIRTYESFLITAHVNPDGDAIGSEVALKSFLEDLGKDALILNASPTPETLSFLDPHNEIQVFGKESDKKMLADFDGIFVLDLNNYEQLGLLSSPVQHSPVPSVCIDHHEGIAEDFASIIVSDTSSAATGILIYELIRSLGGEITQTIADAVYSAIITDTGTFRFSNTDVRALGTALAMVEAGASPVDLHRHVFASKNWATAKLLGPVLGSVESAADGRLAWIQASQELVTGAGGTYDDLDGFVDLIRAIKGVELVLFFKELTDGNVEVSLRSNGNVDAFAIASAFGGGGHKMASGLRVDGPLDKAVERVVAACLQLDGIRE